MTTLPRPCGECTLCCKLPKVPQLDKPANTWCLKCLPGKGCSIHETRPNVCREFQCNWTLGPQIPDEWRPDRSRIILIGDVDKRRLSAHVDPDRPDAWKKEPYHSGLRQWARAAEANNSTVVVFVKRQAFAIMPDRDVDLGAMGPDDIIITFDAPAGGRTRPVAMKVHKDDPRAKRAAEQGQAILRMLTQQMGGKAPAESMDF